MAGLNIVEWTPDQVAEWLTGLGPKISRYIPALKERGLDGAKLLTLRCDDLEYLGMHIIGHQELLLEAVEHLRNFQYEVSRECVQQLAVRVSVVATTLARTLRHHSDTRLETQTLADVARTVHAVKPLVCWLDRWPLVGSGGAGVALGERKAALLKLSLEAATCAQRDRFADQPARAVAAAAAAAATTADYIIQDVSDPMILQPASLDTVLLRQRGKPLGFGVVPSFCGHHQLADIRFGSPAHASGAIHQGDEIVQVGGQCVIGWSGEAVLEACRRCGPELALRVRRRGGRAPPALATPQLHRLHRPQRFPHLLMHREINFQRYVPLRDRSPPPLEKAEESLRGTATEPAAAPAPRADWAASSSDESEPLSPPASPTHLHLDHTRMYPPKPRAAVQRRHTISCGSPTNKRPTHTIEQFWQELKDRKWGKVSGSATVSPAPRDDVSLYARDKAVSCSTGLELSPRPRTCLGVVVDRSPAPRAIHRDDDPQDRNRGKLDKSHSTPAYDFDTAIDEPGSLVAQIIPESPTTPTDSPTILVHSAEKADQILDFKKSSSQIGEAILQQQNRKAEDTSHKKTDSADSTHGRGDLDSVGKDSGVVLRRDEQNKEKVETVDNLELDVEGTGQRDESTTEKILETINIAMMEHRRRSIMDGKVDVARVVKVSDHIKHEESLSEEQKASTAPARYPYLRSTPAPAPVRPSRGDTPPSPPPRPVPRTLPSTPLATSPALEPPTFPVLRAVPRPMERSEPTSPLKPMRPIDGNQISVPLRHITKHDIRVIPSERRELPAINSEADPRRAPGDVVMGAHAHSASADAPTRGLALSPSTAVRGIFPTSKSRSLKKKSSILAKRRCVPARALAARGASGWVWQRVRARGAAQPRWATRHLLLAHNLLYAYRTPECTKADCMIYLEGFTACAAGEVKSRAHAFKVYHTGTAFYFACESREAMLTWIQLIHRATLLPSLSTQMDVSKQFSETDYSETESENESPEKRSEREKDREKDKDKDKSKFGSLKKLAHRVQRSESHEDVRHSSTSLDRKYLRFFSRNKSKDDSKANKSKQSNVPVPTEHYRSYRRVPSAEVSPPTARPSADEARAAKKIPKPINYIHASNPNLLDFEKSDFVTKPTLQVPKPKPKQTENLVGFVTLEQFMLKKQEEERRHLYTDRVLLGVQRDRERERAEHRTGKRAAMELQKRLDRIVPDVIYGEVCSPNEIPVPVLELQQRHLPPAPAHAHDPPPPPTRTRASRDGKPVSVKGKDGYEKIVYTDDLGGSMSEKEMEMAANADPSLLGYETIFGDESPKEEGGARRGTPPLAPDRWRDSLRRNDKVHTASGSESAPALKSAAQYTPLPHAHAQHNLHLALDSWSGSNGNGSGENASSGGVSRLRLMFGGGRSTREAPRQWQPPPSGGGSQYPHLVCPPTFHPETYSLARLHPQRGKRETDT